MKRFVRRNIKYIITAALLLLVLVIALGHTRIRSVEEVQQEARELAEQVTAAPAGTDDGNDIGAGAGNQTGQYAETADSDGESRTDTRGQTGQNGADTVSPEPEQADPASGQNGADAAKQKAGSGKTKHPSGQAESARSKASGQTGSDSKTKKSQSTKRKISDGKDRQQDSYHTDPVPSGKPEPVNRDEQTVDTTVGFYVYLSIDVKTILDHMDDLTKGLEKYVPEDGLILPKTKVVCYEGETVWDVLSRECKARGINVEAVNTQVYGSVYLERIHNIGQFDCGPLSGWMYAVDGWFPNYGCSRYVLEEGEYIQWRYSCVGGGKDLEDTGR